MTKPPQKLAITSLGASYYQRPRALGLFVFFGMICSLFVSVSVSASAVTEGFAAEENYPVGSVVSVSQNNPGKVELANIGNAAFITGVTAGVSDGLIALSNSASDIFVAVGGDSPVMVSTINGQIQEGDLLGPSAISGVAQRTTVVDGGRVLGVSLASFDGSTGGQSAEIGDQEVVIGLVPMRLLLTEVAGTQQDTLSFLERVGVAITGTEVSIIRIVISSVIFIVTIIISALLLHGSIRGSFNSLGRNPLASESIFSSLMHVTLVAATIMVLGVVVSYLVMAA